MAQNGLMRKMPTKLHIAMPYEMLPVLGYSESDWVYIKSMPTHKTLQKLLRLSNEILDRISSSCVAQISRSIPVQEFKEEIVNLMETHYENN